jgi:colicin import membrane protein
MARRLKTYLTSSGFFDVAVAAPSMKAAADAWGLRTNVFRQGFAKETHDPSIVAATMAKPGVVLKRPVGSSGLFTEHAHLPQHLPLGKDTAKLSSKPKSSAKAPARKLGAREAELAFEREEKRHEFRRQSEQAARERERLRRERAISRAEEALERAEREHEAKIKKFEAERAALEKRSQLEDARWEKQKERLEHALRRART